MLECPRNERDNGPMNISRVRKRWREVVNKISLDRKINAIFAPMIGKPEVVAMIEDKEELGHGNGSD